MHSFETGSMLGSSRLILFFYKSKRYYFDKKNKKKIVNELQQSFLLDFAGSTRSPRVVTSPIFS